MVPSCSVHQTGISSLPPELLHEIGSKLHEEDNRTLRLVNHQINTAIEPLALCVLYPLSFHVLLQKRVERLEAYASRLTKAVDYVRTVVLRGPSAAFSPERSRLLGEKLAAAMNALGNVQAINWKFEPRDTFPPEWLLTYVLTRKVTSFSIDFSLEPKLPSGDWSGFSSLSCLQSLVLKNAPVMPISPSGIVPLKLANSLGSSLSHLDISTGVRVATEHGPTLHEYFPSTGSSPLKLKQLHLSGLRILLDDVTIPHIRYLKSLRIRNNLNTPSFGSDYKRIWDTLRAESIYLTSINLNLTDVEDGFLKYLASAQEIKELVLESEHVWSSPRRSTELALRFFHETLPKICTSLETLHIESHLANGWCVGSWNASAFATCTKLKHWEMSVIDLTPGEISETMKSIQRVKDRMPLLESSKISSAGEWRDRFSRQASWRDLLPSDDGLAI